MSKSYTPPSMAGEKFGLKENKATMVEDYLLNKNANEALIMNVQTGDASKVMECLNVKGIDVNFKRTPDGKTALHFACENGNLEMVQLLLSNKANPNIKDNGNNLPRDILPDTREKRAIIKELDKASPKEPRGKESVLDRIKKAFSCSSVDLSNVVAPTRVGGVAPRVTDRGKGV